MELEHICIQNTTFKLVCCISNKIRFKLRYKKFIDSRLVTGILDTSSVILNETYILYYSNIVL